MKSFKSIDCAIQGVLIVLGFMMGLWSGEMLSDMTFFTGYFLVGGWQLISVIVHFFYDPPYKTLMRRIYLYTLGVVILALVVSLPADGIITMLFVLLFFSPIMAVYYLITCIRETQQLSLIMAQAVNPDKLPG
ncbi:hypothetical protein D3H65_27525 [Paraflavitalea soli]|uniref:Uncharacterized protein n=1 Tax=Paraflavitalea soli TaxID=2315862 RepID=A0A3B7MWW1_9BACT|nr:hypothetical protein [Paraflavitalea soli]AXY77506.1 hypothetical protein D3H65_27525 [Paraflavitalea soli]